MARRSQRPELSDEDGDDLPDGPLGEGMDGSPQVNQRETPEVQPAKTDPQSEGVRSAALKRRRTGDETPMEGIKVQWKPSMAPPAVSRTEFWLGVTDESPLQNIVLGCGILFPRYSREIPIDKDGNVVKGKETKGIRVRLTAEAVKSIEEYAAREVLRRVGVNTVQLDTKDSRYERNANDLPVGCYIFAKRVTGHMPVDWNLTDPSPIIEVDIAA